MITARDRKIIFVLIPLVLLAGYWFMVLAPKRAQSDKVSQELTKAQSARDTAEQQVAQLNAAKASFAGDYATVIRLGKAVPTTVDMPSLLVQLDRAARGTGIQINDLKPGTATDASSSAGSSPAPSSGASGGAAPSSGAPSGTAPGGGNNPAAPGSPKAQSFPGKQAQKAGTGVSQANGTNQANADKAGGAGAPAAGAAAPSPPGLQSVPLTFTMNGTFFNLADFFHRMKRFVRVVNNQIVVRGRLMTIESFDFKKSDTAAGSPGRLLTADVTATIYITPPDQGATAGASASGPASATGASPSPAGAPSTPSTPTATATP
jgi:Tfp pilus assembly protein PilO